VEEGRTGKEGSQVKQVLGEEGSRVNQVLVVEGTIDLTRLSA
jgi:hypothetical protein